MKVLKVLLSSALLLLMLPTRAWAIEFKETTFEASKVETVKSGKLIQEKIATIGSTKNAPSEDLLVFENPDIPKGSHILSAQLILTLKDYIGRIVTPRISTDTYPHLTAPQDYKSYLNIKPGFVKNTYWTNLPKGLEGTILRSPDISELLQDIVKRLDWTPQTPLLISIQDYNSDNYSQVKYFANDLNFAPKLKIKYVSPILTTEDDIQNETTTPAIQPNPTPPITSTPTITPTPLQKSNNTNISTRTMISSRITRGGNSETTVSNTVFSDTTSIQSFGKDSYGPIQNTIFFEDLPVEKGKKIKSAYITFTLSGAAGEDVSVNIAGIDQSIPIPPQNIDDFTNLITNLTTTKIKWAKIPEGKWGTVITSPDISILLQELVNRDDWKKGDPVLLYFSDNNSSDWSDRTFLTGDFAGTDGKPTLVIEYEEDFVAQTHTPLVLGETTTKDPFDLLLILTPILKED